MDNVPFYQICFTRTGGQGVNDGWKVLNFSPDIPDAVKSNYEKMQSRNRARRDKSKLDSENVYELETDGKYIYISQIHYGLYDGLGRPNIFVHGFVLGEKNIEQDPYCVTGISRENFFADEENTAHIPSRLKYNPRTSLQEAVVACGLDRDKYLTLMQSVYAVLESRTSLSLYIQYEGTEESLAKLMYCIYCAMPYSLRRRISFATSDNASSNKKTLLFGTQIPSGEKYIIPQTGENNILNPSQIKRWERFEFMKYVPGNFLDWEKCRDYFKELESRLSALGFSKEPPYNIIKIASELGRRQDYAAMDAEDLAARLNELLNAGIKNSAELDNAVMLILDSVTARNISLNKTISEKLSRYLREAKPPALLETYCRYQKAELDRRSADEAAKYLAANFDFSSELFKSVRDLLKKDGGGKCKKILDLFYSKYYTEIGGPRNILSFHESVKDLLESGEFPRIRDFLSDLVRKVFYGRVAQNKGEDKALAELEKLLNTIFGAGSERAMQCRAMVIRHYWESFDFGETDMEKLGDYQKIVTKDNDKYKKVEIIASVLEQFAAKRPHRFFQELRSFRDNNPCKLMQPQIDSIVDKIIDYCLKYKDSPDYVKGYLGVWMGMAILKNRENPILFLVENDVRVFTQHFLEESEEKEVKKSLRSYLTVMRDYVARKDKNYELVENILRDCKNYQQEQSGEKLRDEGYAKPEAAREDKKNIFGALSGFVSNIFSRRKTQPENKSGGKDD
ncbi:MAG: hypothetical protein LBC56_04080 [Oscillospiraceae bacterium]|nr:hypothetical protein [Oscillospiraceae bacterium]